MEKEHESYIKSKHQMSDESSHNPNSPSNVDAIRNKMTMKNINRQASVRKGRQLSNIIIDDGSNPKFGSQKRSQVGVTEYVKEIKSIKIIFPKIELI
jgi:hypothetical protein